MNVTVLMVTLLLEVLLLITRLMATWLKKNDRYGSTKAVTSNWKLLPYDFSRVDWYLQRHDADKGDSPPKVSDPHSRDV